MKNFKLQRFDEEFYYLWQHWCCGWNIFINITDKITSWAPYVAKKTRNNCHLRFMEVLFVQLFLIVLLLYSCLGYCSRYYFWYCTPIFKVIIMGGCHHLEIVKRKFKNSMSLWTVAAKFESIPWIVGWGWVTTSPPHPY